MMALEWLRLSLDDDCQVTVYGDWEVGLRSLPSVGVRHSCGYSFFLLFYPPFLSFC